MTMQMIDAAENAQRHEDCIIDNQAADGDFSTETVGDEVTGDCIAESIEKIAAYSDECQIDPRLIPEQVCERFQ